MRASPSNSAGGSAGSVLILEAFASPELVGGYSESAFSRRCFIYDSQGDRYHGVADLPLGLSGPAIVRAGNFVYICGGEPQMRARSPLVLRARVDGV